MRNEDQTEDKWDDLEESSEADADKYKQDLREQFVMLPMAICADADADDLTPLDIVIYAYCLAKAGPKGCHWWPYDKLSKLIGRPQTTIKDAFRKLEAAGHIIRHKQKTGRGQFVFVRTRVDEGGEIIIKGPRKRLRKAAAGAESAYSTLKVVPDIAIEQEAA